MGQGLCRFSFFSVGPNWKFLLRLSHLCWSQGFFPDCYWCSDRFGSHVDIPVSYFNCGLYPHSWNGWIEIRRFKNQASWNWKVVCLISMSHGPPKKDLKDPESGCKDLKIQNLKFRRSIKFQRTSISKFKDWWTITKKFVNKLARYLYQNFKVNLLMLLR